MKQLKRNALKKKAEENVSVRREGKFLKNGQPNEPTPRHGVPLQARTVGMSKGITRNMGDFESLRVDVWLTDYIEEGEDQREALARVEEIVDEVLEEAVLSMVDD